MFPKVLFHQTFIDLNKFIIKYPDKIRLSHSFYHRFGPLIILILAMANNCMAQDSGIAIINVKAFTEPFKKPIERATILINQGKFEKVGSTDSVNIPSGYKVINGEGKYATAGYWNSHVHFIERKWDNASSKVSDSLEMSLREMFTSKGFVYVFDIAQFDFNNLNSLRDRINKGKLVGPSILAVGVPFTSKSPFYIKPIVLPELKTEKEVRRHIKKQLAEGANGIKIWSASPTGTDIDYLSPQLIKLASDITKKHNIPLFAHPSNIKGVENAANNGVSVLAHVAADDRIVWDPILVKKLVDHNVALIPTLKLHAWDLRIAGIDVSTSKLVSTAINQLSVFNKAGGLVLFGTDVGYMDDYDTKEEYTYMSAAGMSFDQILASLTINPAKKFNYLKQTGTIQEGRNADLVLLEENPVVDPKNFSAVELTIHKGKIIFDKKIH